MNNSTKRLFVVDIPAVGGGWVNSTVMVMGASGTMARSAWFIR
jgi:hypothetical protein